MSDTMYYSQPYKKVSIERVVEIETPLEPVLATTEVCKSYLDPYCSCMVYLQNKGLPIKGNAEDIEVNLFQLPVRGDVVLFKYGHAAFVEEVYSEYLFISEWNYYEGKYSERLVPVYSKDIKGYWRTPPTVEDGGKVN